MEFHVGGCISHFAIEDSKGGPARILLFVIEMMRYPQLLLCKKLDRV